MRKHRVFFFMMLNKFKTLNLPIFQLGCTVREIINMVTLSVVDTQIKR